MGWRTTRAGRVGTGDCGGIEEVAALVRTDRGNGVREEKRETEIGRVSGGKGEKRIIRERREWLAWWSIVHDALGQGGNVVGYRGTILFGNEPFASCINVSL